jgi:hypothetical protein
MGTSKRRVLLRHGFAVPMRGTSLIGLKKGNLRVMSSFELWLGHHGSNSLIRGLNAVKKRRAKATDLPRIGVADSLPRLR